MHLSKISLKAQPLSLKLCSAEKQLLTNKYDFIWCDLKIIFQIKWGTKNFLHIAMKITYFYVSVLEISGAGGRGMATMSPALATSLVENPAFNKCQPGGLPLFTSSLYKAILRTLLTESGISFKDKLFGNL